MISVTNGEASLDEVSELLPSWKRHLRAASSTCALPSVHRIVGRERLSATRINPLHS
jgi:hypothetical protein